MRNNTLQTGDNEPEMGNLKQGHIVVREALTVLGILRFCWNIRRNLMNCLGRVCTAKNACFICTSTLDSAADAACGDSV
jgi:hypothetical protein